MKEIKLYYLEVIICYCYFNLILFSAATIAIIIYGLIAVFYFFFFLVNDLIVFLFNASVEVSSFCFGWIKKAHNKGPIPLAYAKARTLDEADNSRPSLFTNHCPNIVHPIWIGDNFFLILKNDINKYLIIL